MSVSGFYEGTALTDKTFYGFRNPSSTGHLDVEVIGDSTGTVVIPDPLNASPDDYKAHLWSADTLTFRWGGNGHLLVEFI
jgi:hypothetical protein